MRYTSASDRHSKTEPTLMERISLFFRPIVLSLLLLMGYHGNCHAELLDRVAAYVDDTAITLSEFNASYDKAKKTTDNVSRSEVINSMINQILLLKEARKMRLDAKDKTALLKDYIDIKIRAAILIKESQIEKFYKTNQTKFEGKPYLAVRDDIERYLFEKETNERLKSHLNDLWTETEIKINCPEQ